MRFLVLMLVALLMGCEATSDGNVSAAQCLQGENLLANLDFGSSDPAAGLRPWSSGQHAGEKSFSTSVDNGVLTIEKIGTQPWFRFSQAPQARSLQGASLVFRSEIRLALDTDGPGHGFDPGGGLQVLVWGDPDPVTGGDRLVFDSTMAHEPRLGTTDWMEVTVAFTVPPTATRMRVGFVQQANGNMQVRNPGLFNCSN